MLFPAPRPSCGPDLRARPSGRCAHVVPVGHLPLHRAVAGCHRVWAPLLGGHHSPSMSRDIPIITYGFGPRCRPSDVHASLLPALSFRAHARPPTASPAWTSHRVRHVRGSLDSHHGPFPPEPRPRATGSAAARLPGPARTLMTPPVPLALLLRGWRVYRAPVCSLGNAPILSSAEGKAEARGQGWESRSSPPFSAPRSQKQEDRSERSENPRGAVSCPFFFHFGFDFCLPAEVKSGAGRGEGEREKRALRAAAATRTRAALAVPPHVGSWQGRRVV